MSARQLAYANPVLLVWAREASGYKLDEVADLAKIRPEKLAAAEAGRDDYLTMRELERLAKRYERTAAFFFLARPPGEPPPEALFRRLRDAPALPWPPGVRHVVRDVRSRQDEALELLATLEEEPVWPTTELPDISGGDAETVGGRIRLALGLDHSNPMSSWEMRHWVDAVEALGILVMQSGDIGPVEVSRGFASPDPNIPAIVLNTKDDPRARVFTLLHELVHLIASRRGSASPGEQAIESIAGATLMPAASFDRLFENAVADIGILGAADAVGTRYGVTPRAAATRARMRDLITASELGEIFFHLDQRPPRKPSDGGHYYRTQLTYLGPEFTRLVFMAFDAHLVGYTRAAQLLAIKASNFPGLRKVLDERTALV